MPEHNFGANEKDRWSYAICGKTRREFAIRMERKPEGWLMVYAAEDVDSSGGFGGNGFRWHLEEDMVPGSEYACPFCGNIGPFFYNSPEMGTYGLELFLNNSLALAIDTLALFVRVWLVFGGLSLVYYAVIRLRRRRKGYRVREEDDDSEPRKRGD